MYLVHFEENTDDYYSENFAKFLLIYEYFQKWCRLKFRKFCHSFLGISLKSYTFVFPKIFVNFLTKSA